MYNSSSVPHIKKSQKEALIFKAISRFFHNIQIDESTLLPLSITRVELSQDKSFCRIFFYTEKGLSEFKTLLQTLKLYKPSMRKSLSNSIHGKYTPDIRFLFDDKFEKQRRLDEILASIKKK